MVTKKLHVLSTCRSQIPIFWALVYMLIMYICTRKNYWRSNIVNSFIYLYQKCLQISLMNGTFIIFKDEVLTTTLLATSCYPANTYLFKVNNRNTTKRCEISSKLTINVDVIDVILVFLLLILNIFRTFL